MIVRRHLKDAEFRCLHVEIGMGHAWVDVGGSDPAGALVAAVRDSGCARRLLGIEPPIKVVSSYSFAVINSSSLRWRYRSEGFVYDRLLYLVVSTWARMRSTN